MAVSGSFARTFGPNNQHQLYISYQETAVDTTKATSKLDISVYIKSLSSSAKIVASATKTTEITVEGKTYTFNHSGIQLSAYGSVYMGHIVTDAIQHSTTDGSKSVNISVKQEIGVNWSNGTTTYNITTEKTGIALEKIARSSTLSFGTSATIGTNLSIAVTKQNTSYTHTIEYSFAGTTGTICSNVSATSITWAIPSDLANKIPNATSGTCTLTCTTYSGTTAIGSNQKSLTLNVDGNLKPTISSVSVTDSVCGGSYGYLQNYCKAKIVTTASGAAGSTIKSCVVNANGETLTGTTVTTQTLKTSGTMTIKVTVTDSRGRTATLSKSITVNPYDTPKFDVTINRCNADGSIYSGGSYIKISGSATVYAVAGKVISFKAQSPSDARSVTLTADNSSFEIIMPCDPDHPTEIALTINDGISSQSRLITVESTVSWMDMGDDGVSMAFGGICSKPGQDTFKLPVEFEKGAFVNGYKLFYAPGDEWSENGTIAAGHVTNLQTDLCFLIPTIPIMGNVRLQELQLCVRTPNGYYPWVYSKDAEPVYNQLDYNYLTIISGGNVVIDNTFESITVSRRSGGIYVCVRCKNKIVPTNGSTTPITNNTPLGYLVKYTAECY